MHRVKVRVGEGALDVHTVVAQANPTRAEEQA